MVDSSIPDRFQVLEELRHGDAVVVVRAMDRLTRREVILQRPADALSALWRDKTATETELRAARALACVSHPGVVRLLDVIETGAGPLVVMEPVPGETLAERLVREGPLEAEDVRRIGLALSDALAAVHAQGIVHRGICGGNVILRPDGSPCLVGFVFAKFDARSGEMPGTTFVYVRGDGPIQKNTLELPPHPAPEQIQGQPADARSDLFGLGWTLYEALTGKTPYPRDLAVETWTAPVDPSTLAANVPKAFAKALLKCLHASPNKRFASASELHTALEAMAPKSAAGSSSRKMWIAASMAGVLAIGGAAWFARGSNQSADAADKKGVGLAHLIEPQRPPEDLSDGYDNSYALLIGIGQGYDETGFRNLKNPEHDVDAITKSLGQMTWEHWQVDALKGVDATRPAIKDRLAALAEKTKKNDRVLIYYAGHGAAHPLADQRGFIIPHGAKQESEDKGHSTWLSFEDSFKDFFDSTKAKHVLVATDCCYGGRMNSPRVAMRSAPHAYTSRLLAQRAHIIITSGQRNQEVKDGPIDSLSPFAKAFLAALSDPNRAQVTSGDLFATLSDAFLDDADQQPDESFIGAHDGGQFVFFTKPR